MSLALLLEAATHNDALIATALLGIPLVVIMVSAVFIVGYAAEIKKLLEKRQ